MNWAMFEQLLDLLQNMSLLSAFALGMAIVLFVPRLSAHIGLPAAVGLLLAGVVFGPHGLHITREGMPVLTFFAEVGKLLIMFFAGMEIDLAQAKRTGGRSLLFGSLTFLLPLAAGTTVGLIFNYSWVSSLLIGSLMASHTLIGYPILQRLGLGGKEVVTVTVGATVLTDVSSLMVLAVCLPIHTSGFSSGGFAWQVIELALYVPLVVFGLSAVGKWLFRRKGYTNEYQVGFTLMVIALAGLGAELINLEAIIGAFLAGLAVNRAIKKSEAKNELEFVGNLLFIPPFFIYIGAHIDVPVFLETLIKHLDLVIAIVGGLVGTKFLAALATQWLIGYTRTEGLIMWSLSLPQVAATLAAAVVAYQAKNATGVRLIDEPVINTVVVLMVATSILGPILTERFGRKLAYRSQAAGTASS
ncbi:MAG TPA: cation:proton antiporter [Nitrospiraceae bacterium]|nr:cation:proton antiporter [Nitrospiraceae bacterium]